VDELEDSDGQHFDEEVPSKDAWVTSTDQDLSANQVRGSQMKELPSSSILTIGSGALDNRGGD